MELALEKEGDHPQLDMVVKGSKDNEGNVIGLANQNPIMDTIMYEVQLLDCKTQELSENVIIENIFAQVNQEGRRHILLESIIIIRTNEQGMSYKDSLIASKNRMKREKNNNQGLESLCTVEIQNLNLEIS